MDSLLFSLYVLEPVGLNRTKASLNWLTEVLSSLGPKKRGQYGLFLVLGISPTITIPFLETFFNSLPPDLQQGSLIPQKVPADKIKHLPGICILTKFSWKWKLLRFKGILSFKARNVCLQGLAQYFTCFLMEAERSDGQKPCPQGVGSCLTLKLAWRSLRTSPSGRLADFLPLSHKHAYKHSRPCWFRHALSFIDKVCLSPV